jgi:ribosomal protein S18 acetylase RimI-like enzyme
MNITVLPNAEIEVYQTQIVTIYRDAFTSPPYHKPETEISDFARSLLKQLDRDDYKFVAAFGNDSEQITGFAYGYNSAAGRWWYEHVKPALEERGEAEWLDGSFQFTEIAVSPKFHGQGIGGRLHDALLNGIRHERAVLSTLQADTAAHRLYRKRGWVRLCEDFFFPGVDRRYQIMGLRLNAHVTGTDEDGAREGKQ